MSIFDRVCDRVSLFLDSSITYKILSILDFLENVCYFVLLGLLCWALYEFIKELLD